VGLFITKSAYDSTTESCKMVFKISVHSRLSSTCMNTLIQVGNRLNMRVEVVAYPAVCRGRGHLHSFNVITKIRVFFKDSSILTVNTTNSIPQK